MPSLSKLFVLFALSGFAGIIYESIWSHYLKLLLGHAAYAQTIVLIIFMGGMAGGAWLGARLEKNIQDPLKVYALIEITIGVLALGFHPTYVAATEFAFSSWFPSLAQPLAVGGAKVALSAALVLPQSLLLGMTFPMMTVGMLKRGMLPSGFTVSNLYFVNSLGAAVGVLASGFLFLGLLGLPGTIRLAGCLNIVIAVAVYLVAKAVPPRTGAPTPVQTVTQKAASDEHHRRLILAAAALTGCASFIYEISWIRMLNMVLGTSTHSFELMLSAFIFGLALGGWLIRKQLDRITNLLSVLGFIQIAMGALAVATLAFYDFSFLLMSLLHSAVTATPIGYGLHMIFSNGIAFMIMLPVTVCAGMTLPILTHYLLKSGAGNRSVGEVYAANTAGAIVGVIIAVHALLPHFGLKVALLVGAAIDLALGAYLLRRYVADVDISAARAAMLGALAFTATCALVIELDPLKLSGGVFRHGKPALDDDTVMEMRADGKSASVSVFLLDATTRVIATNGKPDASIQTNPDLPPSTDEHTQVLTGAVPMLLRPQMKRAAVIGIGSGMSTHVLLQNPGLEHLDTIEIESKMVAGAELFRPHVEATFADPRSHIHVDDARTFFAATGGRYDAIISEPSNPWVAGVSGLFSVEFYRHVKRHLEVDGIFAQWLQLYEIDLTLLASIFKAFGEQFPNYLVFEMDDGNLLLVSGSGLAEANIANAEQVFAMGDMRRLLERIEMQTAGDLLSRYLASNKILQPLFETYPISANSDFFPVLDLNAAHRRFLKADSRQFGSFGRALVPITEMLGDNAHRVSAISDHRKSPYRTLQALFHARILNDWLSTGKRRNSNALPATLALQASVLSNDLTCEDDDDKALHLDALVGIANATLGLLDRTAAETLVAKLSDLHCYPEGALTMHWQALLKSIAARDPAAMREHAKALLDTDRDALAGSQRALLYQAYLLANLVGGTPAENERFWATVSTQDQAKFGRSMSIKLLRALSSGNAH